MVNLAIEETSGVDHPAHLHEGWLVMKSADESEVQRVLDETLTEEDSTMEDTTTTTIAEEVEVEKAMTLEDAMAKIAELETKLASMLEKAMHKPKGMDKMDMNQMEDESDSDYEKRMKEMKMSKSNLDEDFMKSAPESVVKMITDLRKQAEDATAELQVERDSRADAEAIEKTKGWANLNLESEKVGPALRRLSTVDSELAKAVEGILTSVNAQAESAQIFAEIGKSANFKSGNAYERMTTLAKSAVEEGVAKSMAQAIADVASKNPDLYSQYLSEKGA
jgi:hypothetical protein